MEEDEGLKPSSLLEVEIAGLTPDQVAIRDAILSLVPEGAQPLFISMTFNNVKGVYSTSSDIDFKMIVQHSQKDYMLQRIRQSQYVKSQHDSVKLEGTIVDALHATNHVARSNTMAYECF